METRFTKEHEWVRLEGDVATCGITQYAADQLGDVVYAEMPQVGTFVKFGAQFAVVESAKAVSEIYAPLSGEIVAVNETLPANLALINASPEDEAWFVKIKFSNRAEFDGLMDEAAYKDFTK